MRALNLHLPHLRLPHLRLPHLRLPHIWRPHLTGHGHASRLHVPVMGNAWALLLAAVLAIAMLAGLWMSTTTPFHPQDVLPL